MRRLFALQSGCRRKSNPSAACQGIAPTRLPAYAQRRRKGSSPTRRLYARRPGVRWAAISAAILLIGGTQTASAHTVIPTPGPYQGWVDSWQAPTADETVWVGNGPCPYSGWDEGTGCSSPMHPEVWIDTDYLEETVLAYHLGERFDYWVLTDYDRRVLMDLWGVPRQDVAILDWVNGTVPGSWPLTPDRYFADAYQACARNGGTEHYGIRDEITDEQLAATCQQINVAYARQQRRRKRKHRRQRRKHGWYVTARLGPKR